MYTMIVWTAAGRLTVGESYIKIKCGTDLQIY